MLGINLIIDNMTILSIQKEDVIYVGDYLKNQCISQNEELEISDIYEKFLEYYVSENEFFLKINDKETDEILGIIKGRVEFKNPHEAWIWSISLNKSIRSKGIGSIILKKLSIYLKEEYGVRDFYTRIIKEDGSKFKFWTKNGYEVIRVSEELYNTNDKKTSVFILKKSLGRYNNGQIYAMEK
ncbi:ribosomal protein S18 acetylase RimI-like enzyme [Clostridium pascui]|uniref:GNAT family N-acetyltransferase n=1 Tax=Clostridium pascui TaxID=46609 RepID=UPI00195CCB57|nr:GNAT family N-acetyltransferase [Clostridium pascui]MBM7870162.1 ribosomal protein S18 acetylase RimI-like enzyme [Clostridium pascui]